MDGGWTGGKSEIRKFEMGGCVGLPGFAFGLAVALFLQPEAAKKVVTPTGFEPVLPA